METTTEANAKIVATQYAERLRSLYTQIREWLGEEHYVFEQSEITLEQMMIGEYTAPTMVIRNKGSHSIVASLEPVGALIIAAAGRVDIQGDIDSDYLLYLTPSSGIYLKTAIKGTHQSEGYEETVNLTPYREVPAEGWYRPEMRGLGRVKSVSKELFLDILLEVSPDEVFANA
jgi:hypothetical protein